MSFNIDGLPLFKSFSKQFWPILGLLHTPGNRDLDSVFVVEVFSGSSKPLSPSDYFLSLMKELGVVIYNDIVHEGNIYLVTLRCVVCDTPARSFVNVTKSHNAYFGCGKYTAEGEFCSRITFSVLDAPL